MLTLVWSEFGRRPEENDSDGTDHGAAGNAFLIGSPARGKMIGEWPGLLSLDEDENLRSTFDFRSLYCGLIEQWFGVDAGAVIPNASAFPRAALLGKRARALRLPATLVALAAVALIPGASTQAADGAERARADAAPARLLVTAREFSLGLSRTKLAAGRRSSSSTTSVRTPTRDLVAATGAALRARHSSAAASSSGVGTGARQVKFSQT